MARHFTLPATCFLILASASPGAGRPREWQVDGVTRKATVYAPATPGPTPLVFAFHGHGGSAGQAARSFDLHTRWPEAIVVYPQGLNTPGRLTDPQGLKPGWQQAAGDQGDRDLKFFDAVLKSLQSEFKIDARRVYATGHSNGGAFTYLLWAERPEVLAAVAPSGATAGASAKSLKPKPALHVAGRADPLVKFAWQQATMTAVRTVNECAAEGQPWATAGDLVGTVYPSKAGTPFVSLLSPGTHKFPTEAAGLMVKFFKEHQLAAAAPGPAVTPPAP